jgi:seryl-tRNA synthetase
MDMSKLSLLSTHCVTGTGTSTQVLLVLVLEVKRLPHWSSAITEFFRTDFGFFSIIFIIHG